MIRSFFAQNWSVIIILIVLLIAIAGAVYAFINLTPLEKHKKIKEWLLYAVTVAEHDMGGGTGQIKLRQVYDMFLQVFPFVSNFISFEKFSGWVDETLEKFKNMLAQNDDLQSYVEE